MNSERSEPVEDILRAVHERYPDLDMEKFHRGPFKQWRARGLFPRPIRRPGRGRRHGKGAIYPAGTTAQVLRILEMRAEPGRFDPEQALWRLWWEGWPIDTAAIRTRLEAAVVSDVRHEAMSDGKPPPIATKLRKRAGPEGFGTLTEVFHRLQTGGVVGDWRMRVALPILYRIGGIEGLRRDVPQADMPDVGRATADVVPIAESLRRQGSATSPDALREALAEDPDIDQARDDLQRIVRTGRALWLVVAPLLSDTRLVRELIPVYEKAAWDLLPEAVLYMIALRRVPAYAARFDELRKHDDIAAELRQAIATEHQQA